MTEYGIIKTEGDFVGAVKILLQKLLLQNLVDAVFVAAKTPYSSLPMPILFSDPEKMKDVDPLAPVAPFNAARQAAPVARYAVGRRLAFVLRPCEIRGLIELAKLKQCILDDVIIISFDCLGRLENNLFLEQTQKNPNFTSAFYSDIALQEMVTGICKACEHFQPKGADMVLSFPSNFVEEQIGVVERTKKCAGFISELGLNIEPVPKKDESLYKELFEKRIKARDILFKEIADKISDIKKFQKLIGTCLNCYNCRVVCPVCYCKECVFLTDVFAHKPELILRRTEKKGLVKLPSDTSMFHLTRLVHMSHACVGCGQCSSVCPSNIPVADIFRTVAAKTQDLYGYEPGRDVSDPIPYMDFKKESEDDAR